MAEYKDYDEDFDPQWENPSIEDIDNVPDMKQDEMGFDDDGNPTVTCEYDEAEAALHEDHKDFVHDFNENGAALIEATDTGIPDIDTTEVANIINNNPELLVAETRGGEYCGQAMEEASGTISDGDLFMAESDYLASKSEDIPDTDETPNDEQLDGQMEFDENTDLEDNSNSDGFEIGGHSDMSLEEVQDYQSEGWDMVEDLRGETWDTTEPGAEMSHQEFFDAQDAFEADIMSSGSSDSMTDSTDE